MADSSYVYSNVSIYNPVTGHTIACDSDIECNPFKEKTIVDEYVVTEADVLAALNNGGNLEPQDLQVACSGDRGTIDCNVAKNVLNVYAQNLIANYYDPFVALSCTMTADNASAIGGSCQFNVVISNTTKTVVNGLNVEFSLNGTSQTTSQTIALQPEETKPLTYQHSITEDDLYEARLAVSVSASGTSFAGTPINVSKQNAFGIGAANPSIVLTYTDAETGLSRDSYETGDTVSYKATATNAGNVTIFGIAFHDSSSNSDREHSSLAPGESVEWTFSKTLEVGNAIETVTGTISASGRNGEAASSFVKPLRCYVDYEIMGWAYKVAVDASSSLKSSVPFSLFNQPSVELFVDWGDGTTETLDSSMYASASSTLASVHTYAAAGEYMIQVDSSDWDETYVFSYGTSYNTSGISTADQHACVGYFKSTVTEVVNGFPGLKGTNCYSSASAYATSTIRMGNLFQSCSKLTRLPSDLLDNLPATFTNFSSCFSGCTSLTEIPAELFSNASGATSFQSCFSGCTSLQSVPAGLFENASNVTSFASCFYNCTSLTTIPANLFSGASSVTSFQSCFSGCGSLTAIPAGLFNTASSATTFQSCFANCTSLQLIPSGLFNSAAQATTFQSCFYNCSALTEIPAGLFDYCTRNQVFWSCFQNCSSLQLIPEYLFMYNTAANDFDECFNGCTSLNDFSLHIGASSISYCSNFVTYKAGTTRKIYVRYGSTTQSRFNSVASSLGLTIIGE